MSYSASSLFRRHVSGYGDVGTPCPQGMHQVCMLPAPGKPTTPDMCSCHPDAALITQASSSMKYKWGIALGIGVAAIIVYKVAF